MTPISKYKNRLRNFKDHCACVIDASRGYPELRKMFRENLGYELDLENPKTRNEKIQWRKLNDRNPMFIEASDKFAVRGLVQRLLGNECPENLFVELYQVVDREKDIDFAALPDSFVYKPTHGSGWIEFVDKNRPLDRAKIRKRCHKWLYRKYGVRLYEWAYSKIKPRIVFEEFMTQEDGSPADDIKIHVFHGEPKFLQYDFDRFAEHGKQYFTPDWSLPPLATKFKDIPRPEYLSDILDIAAKIGAHFDYVRVDFLCTSNRAALNELTLYSGSGFNDYMPYEFDLESGGFWNLPK